MPRSVVFGGKKKTLLCFSSRTDKRKLLEDATAVHQSSLARLLRSLKREKGKNNHVALTAHFCECTQIERERRAELEQLVACQCCFGCRVARGNAEHGCTRRVVRSNLDDLVCGTSRLSVGRDVQVMCYNAIQCNDLVLHCITQTRS